MKKIDKTTAIALMTQAKNENRPMIEADHLVKTYGRFAAVTDVSFRISAGEVVAFLGVNGAGKSTTMKLLTGYIPPTSGTARIAGIDMTTNRTEGARHLGYLPENGPLYPDMTPESMLSFFAGLYSIERPRRAEAIDRAIELCSLEPVRRKPIGRLSKGYRQRVGMAHVLLHQPEVLILDEPTTGLDPRQILQMRETIRRIGRERTILLSTHILQEVSAVATRVLFINTGRLVFDGPAAEFDTARAEKRFTELSAD